MTRIYIRFTLGNHRINSRTFNKPDSGSRGYIDVEIISLTDPTSSDTTVMVCGAVRR